MKEVIVIVFPNERELSYWRRHEIYISPRATVTFGASPICVKSNAVDVHGVVIATSADLHKLRGMQPLAVIQHYTFDPIKNGIYEWHEFINTIVK